MKRRRIIPYEPRLKQRARELRRHSTLSEVLLWQRLRRKRMCGYDFHRQKPIDRFIVDFYCPDLMLAVEIDGDSHWQKYPNNRERQAKLESLGVRFLRFEDRMVKQDMDNVLRAIEGWIVKNDRGGTAKGAP